MRRTFSDVDFAAFVYQHTYSTSNFQIPFVKSGKTRRFTKLDCGMSNEAMLLIGLWRLKLWILSHYLTLNNA